MSTVESLLSALFAHGPLPVAALVVALLWWACSRILRIVRAESRNPLFVALVLWLWSRHRR
jgi:hypothetical protein